MMKPEDILIVIAMPEEAQAVFDECGSRVRYSGIGKINATYTVTRAIHEKRPELVVNFGTAGSPSFKTHEVVECTKFIQRDIDLAPLGFAKGTTPFDETPTVLETPSRLALPLGVCGTGDNFETQAVSLGLGSLPAPTVIEMEAYALAKVCYKEKLPFLCVKYITDGSDHNASADWASNLPRAAARFHELFEHVLKISNWSL